MYEWLAFALSWDALWLVLFALKPSLRRQMLWASFFTMLTGLTEPIFVPRYWSPQSLFNLSATTHFDVESLIFSWGVGGIGSALYEAILNLKHIRMDSCEQKRERRWLHLLSLVSLPLVFSTLYFFTNINPIYCLTVGLLVGGLTAIACRPDLLWNALIGGLLFLGLYFTMFVLILAVFPDFINSWNHQALSGIFVIGVPLEELTYAFAFGMMWSCVYEHIRYYTLPIKSSH